MELLRTGVGMFFVVVGILVWAGVAIWVASDAPKRGASGVFWGLVTFIGGLTGLGLYGVVRELKVK